MKQINLDRYFRKDSKSRAVAEMLLSGEPKTRQAIAAEADVAVTNINRVLAVLETAGATFDRSIADDGHNAVFKLKSIGDPRRTITAPMVGQQAKIVGAQELGEHVLVDFETSGMRWRGRMMSLERAVPFFKTGHVRAVEGIDDALMVKLDVEGTELPLGWIVPVED